MRGALRQRGARGAVLGTPAPVSPSAVHRTPTRVLDWSGGGLDDLLASAGTATAVDDRVAVRRLHRAIASRMRSLAAFDEWQPASETWKRRRGSCSQRFAVLEAAARAIGIPTCVRGLWVDGAFCYPRVPVLRLAVPDRVLLAWPSFHLERVWVPASELFGPIETLAATNPQRFENDIEALFDALTNTAIDWDGRTRADPTSATVSCDLSAKVVADLGYFTSRDELFAGNAQTARALAMSSRRRSQPRAAGAE